MGNLAPHVDNLKLGKGQLFLARFSSAGVRGGYAHLGNCATFELTLNDETTEIRSSMSRAAGLLKRVTKNRTVELKISGNDFALKNMALVMMGTETAYTQAGGAQVAEALSNGTDAVLGIHYRTRYRQITAVAVKQGATTLVLNTDYTIVDATAGLIKLLETGAADTAEPVTIDYTAAAIAGVAQKMVKGATETSVNGTLLYISDDTSGPNCEVIVFNVSIAPDGALGFIQEDWGEWSIKGAVQDDSQNDYGGDATNPYYSYLEREAA